jgi:mannose-1-phosphate guanylyltransferase
MSQTDSLSYGTLDKSAEFVTVIMAGGSGTRFWPMSRRDFPKQFLALTADHEVSLIRATADRFKQLSSKGDVLVVTASNHIELVRKHLPEAKILAEPEARNTAACIGYAALKVLADVGDVPMLCVAADHAITGVEELCRTYTRAIELARTNDYLIPIGIPPAYPETGYGYIRRGEVVSGQEHTYKVHSFVEKPSMEKALEYLASGEYFWNGGMFVWRAAVLMQALKEFMPGHYDLLQEIAEIGDFAADRVAPIYARVEKISIDYGVMEKARNVVMVAGVGFRWSDVGSWSSWKTLLDERHPATDKNVGFGDTMFIKSRDSLLVSKSKLIAAVGLEGVIVIETDDAILVCNRDNAQDVREVVAQLEQNKREDLL